MRIERADLAADEAMLRACHEAYLAGAPIDDPYGPAMTYRSFVGWLAHGCTEDPQEVWVARDDAGAIAGWYLLTLPERENQHLALLHVLVDPARRRTGLGAGLVRHAAGRAREAGRTVMSGDAREGGAGQAFAGALGARTGLAEIRRVQEIGPVPAALRQEVAPAVRGYSLVDWEGPAPEKYLADVVVVFEAMADMPRDSQREAQIWDADRVRWAEQRTLKQGLRHYTVAAQSLETGELAGLTEVTVDPGLPEWGFQELTAVARSHRGRKLGLLLKLWMLDLLAEREPGLKRMMTGNADGNAAMIAINEKLGYRVLDRWVSLELDLS